MASRVEKSSRSRMGNRNSWAHQPSQNPWGITSTNRGVSTTARALSATKRAKIEIEAQKKIAKAVTQTTRRSASRGE